MLIDIQHSGLAVAPSRPEERSSLGEDGPKGSTHGAETEDPAQEDTSPQEQPSSGEADEDEDEDPAENLLFGYADNDDDPEEESPRVSPLTPVWFVDAKTKDFMSLIVRCHVVPIDPSIDNPNRTGSPNGLQALHSRLPFSPLRKNRCTARCTAP